MARPVFKVDWFDPCFPKIRRAEGEDDAKTFSDCKKEIIRRFQYDRDFAREQIEYYKFLKLRDVES